MAQLGRSYVKPHIGRFIGPFPSLPGPVAPNRVVIARQPTVVRPKPHLTAILGTPTGSPPVGGSFVMRAKQPTVLRPKPHVQSFTGYVAAVAPVSRNLLMTVHTKVPPTHSLKNSVSILNVPQPPLVSGQKLMLMGVS